jgi:hypothetical protein
VGGAKPNWAEAAVRLPASATTTAMCTSFRFMDFQSGKIDRGIFMARLPTGN